MSRQSMRVIPLRGPGRTPAAIIDIAVARHRLRELAEKRRERIERGARTIMQQCLERERRS